MSSWEPWRSRPRPSWRRTSSSSARVAASASEVARKQRTLNHLPGQNASLWTRRTREIEAFLSVNEKPQAIGLTRWTSPQRFWSSIITPLTKKRITIDCFARENNTNKFYCKLFGSNHWVGRGAMTEKTILLWTMATFTYNAVISYLHQGLVRFVRINPAFNTIGSYQDKIETWILKPEINSILFTNSLQMVWFGWLRIMSLTTVKVLSGWKRNLKPRKENLLSMQILLQKVWLFLLVVLL